MCTVSNIGDQYARTWPERWPTVAPYVVPSTQPQWHQIPHKFEPIQDDLRECFVCGLKRGDAIHALFEGIAPTITDQPITRKEFDALREEVLALKKLLEAAKAYDEATGQPDCQMDEKVALIKKVAELVGVDLGEVFGAQEISD